MKTITRCFTAAMLFFALPNSMWGQNIPISVITQDDINNLPLFGKGTSIVNLLPNIQFSSFNNGEDPKQVTNDFNINLRGNYYVMDNVAVVVGLHANSQTIRQEDLEDIKTSTSIFEIGGQYGRYFGDFPLRAEATVGFGTYKIFDNKAATIAYNINVATYLELGQSGTYVEPFIGYAGFRNNFKDQEFKNSTNGLVLGATLVRPIGCGNTFCGFGDEAPTSPYAAGANRVQFLQTGLLGLGSNHRSYMGDNLSNDGLFGYALNLSDYYYAANNLAIGMGFQIDGLSTNDKDSDNKSSSINWQFSPRVRYHAPVQGAINGIFAEGGILIGSNIDKTTFNDGSTNEIKSGTFGWNVGLGYDFYFTKNFSVTGLLDYVDKSQTNRETEVKTKSKGTRFLLGMSYTFGN